MSRVALNNDNKATAEDRVTPAQRKQAAAARARDARRLVEDKLEEMRLERELADFEDFELN